MLFSSVSILDEVDAYRNLQAKSHNLDILKNNTSMEIFSKILHVAMKILQILISVSKMMFGDR